MSNLKERWEELPSKTRRLIVAGAVVVAVLFFFYMAAQGKIEQKKANRAAAQAKQETKSNEDIFDADMLERDLYDRLQAELEEKSLEMDRTTASMKKEVDRVQALAKQMEKLMKVSPGNRVAAPEEDTAIKDPNLASGTLTVPPPPPPPPAEAIQGDNAFKGEYVFATGGPNGNQQQEEYDEIIGGIGHVESTDTEVEEEPVKKNVVRLPVSFMKATLLSGLDGTMGGEGFDNPKPALLRIAAPAVLPNSIRANLKGCFIIASGYGTLATERIDMELVNLSCLSQDGRAVVSEKIKGWIVDADGKAGLRAHVYMKAGKHLSRQFWLGIMKGLAGILKSNATTTSISPLGVTESIDPDKAGEVAVAEGIGLSVGGLEEFYKMLAKQTLPTMEVGPMKKVTVVLREEVMLNIRDNCEDCES